MADLYGTSTTLSSSNQGHISSYFQALHNSSSSSSCMTEFIPSSVPNNMSAATGVVVVPPPLESRQGFSGSRGASQVEGPTGVNMDFCDPGGFFKENVENGFLSVLESDSNASCKRKGISSENDVDEFSCDSEKDPEASEVPLNPPRPRSSSKRRRAAEVHNLSEKRRRSRINEKMKALQSLVPNSNKTDKASMLDEAIEYLKQLQLQVQMLTMRNGLGLPPMCLPGAMQPVQLPHMGRVVEDTFLNRTGIAYPNQERSPQTVYSLPNHCTPSSQSPGITSLAGITNAETSYGFELPVQAQYEQLNPSNSSEEICRENLLPQVQVDEDQCCDNSSSGIS